MTQEIIMSREFEILNSVNEVAETFELIILKPIQLDEDWSCSFYFTNSPENIQKAIIGIDSFQAFSLALQVAKDEIEGRSKRMKITFLEQDNLWL
jgi:hypothetical protein